MFGRDKMYQVGGNTMETRSLMLTGSRETHRWKVLSKRLSRQTSIQSTIICCCHLPCPGGRWVPALGQQKEDTSSPFSATSLSAPAADKRGAAPIPQTALTEIHLRLCHCPFTRRHLGEMGRADAIDCFGHLSSYPPKAQARTLCTPLLWWSLHPQPSWVYPVFKPE